MAKLKEVGWITPASLHLVRNHGGVPKLNWDTHRLKAFAGLALGMPNQLPGVCGERWPPQVAGVPEPRELSMEELVSGAFGPMVSFPITFACAGNRRKDGAPRVLANASCEF